MARIFLSHSSQDEIEAVAIRDWLLQNGWDDVFLDLDPQRGLLAGERWQEALKRAANQCEAVLFVVTPAWAKSKWCIAEFLLAKSLNKHIFGALLKPVELGELPTEFTAEWQLTQLVGPGPLTTLNFIYQDQPNSIELLTSGLTNLRNGLERAGLDARYFPWPPTNELNRSPYPGLKPLEEQDAAIYFGRDLQILRAMETLRGMSSHETEQLFIILGASGTGKSSFLRAGLLPRLRRDDRHFLPLQVIRPEQNIITGSAGLSVAIHNALGQQQTLSSIKTSLSETPEALGNLLLTIQQAAERVLLLANPQTITPTLILAVDQAEELFSPDASSEAAHFLAVLGSCLGVNKPEGLKLIVVFTIRSDRYQPLQTAPELDGLYSRVFDDLKPLSRQRFGEIIAGPAKRASSAGQALEITPELMEALLNENAEGADTLPLLALTLQLLYTEHNQQGELQLESYRTIGGMAGVIENIINGILSSDPQIRQTQLRHLHRAFIPWLVNISADRDLPIRKLANYQHFPEESRELIDALVEKRLLLIDSRGGQTQVEIAHEALLRQWGALKQWIDEERDNLKLAQELEQASEEWQKRKRNPSWLWDQERLSLAEKLRDRPGYCERLIGNCGDFLTASRHQEDAEREDELAKAKQLAEEQTAKAELQEQLRKEADQSRAKISQRSKALTVVLVMMLAALVYARAQNMQSNERLKQATSLRVIAKVQAANANEPSMNDPQGMRLLLAAYHLAFTPQSQNELFKALSATGFQQRLIDTDDAVLAIAFSPDGTRLLSGGMDGALRLWDANTGQPIGKPLEGHIKWVLSVAFSPDSKRLLSGDLGGTIRFWDANTGLPIGKPLEGHVKQVTSLAFSLDGTRLLSGDMDGDLRLWDATTGQPIGTPLKGHTKPVSSVTFSRDGKYLLSGGADKTLRLWDANTGQPIGKPLEGHNNVVNSVAFSPDGKYLLSGSADKTLHLWNANTGQPIGKPLEGHIKPVNSVAFSPDGTRLLSGSGDGTLRLWDTNTGQQIGEPLKGHAGVVSSIAFSADGTHLLSGSYDKTLRIWDVNTGLLIREPLKDHTLPVTTSIAFSIDGKHLLSGHADGTISIWETNTGQLIRELQKGPNRPVTAVAFSTDGNHLLSGHKDGALRIWDANTGQSISEPLEGHALSVTSNAFSHDGKRLLSGYADGTLRIWDTDSGQQIGVPQIGAEKFVYSVAFSSDGKRLLSGYEDGTLRLWDANTGQPIDEPLEGHVGPVNSVAFSRDGTRLLSGGRDRTLRLWDANTGQQIGQPLEAHTEPIIFVDFSPDGKQLLSGSSNATLRLWPLPETWPELLCQKLTHNMSKKQWDEQVSPNITYIKQCPELPIALDNPLPKE